MPQPWIDIHGHYSVPTTASDREAAWRSIREGEFLAPAPWHWTPESTLAYLDKANIALQFLNVVPKTLQALKDSNTYGASLVSRYPSRFGLLAGLPTNDVSACLTEIDRASTDLNCDGFAMMTEYHGVLLSDENLDPAWAELDRRRAVVFVHPNAYIPSSKEDRLH